MLWSSAAVTTSSVTCQRRFFSLQELIAKWLQIGWDIKSLSRWILNFPAHLSQLWYHGIFRYTCGLKLVSFNCWLITFSMKISMKPQIFPLKKILSWNSIEINTNYLTFLKNPSQDHVICYRLFNLIPSLDLIQFNLHLSPPYRCFSQSQALWKIHCNHSHISDLIITPRSQFSTCCRSSFDWNFHLCRVSIAQCLSWDIGCLRCRKQMQSRCRKFLHIERSQKQRDLVLG